MNYDMHTPELEEYYNIPGNNTPTVETVNMFAGTPLEFEPGEGWNYGLSHDVLGALVEILSGEKLETYIKTHIFDLLGMENSTFLHPLEEWEGFARQYNYDAKTGQFVPAWRYWCHLGKEYASGGGGCISAVEDYIKFLEALRVGDVILKKETINLMATDHLTEQQRATYTRNSPSVGYGLGMRTPRGNPACTDFGWGGTADAYASVDPVNNVTLYYAQHVLNAPNRPLRPWLYEAVRADLLGQTIKIPITQADENPERTY